MKNEKLATLLKEYEDFQKLNLNIDITRGKPEKRQLDLSNELLDMVNSHSNFTDKNGTDVRNYGEAYGIEEIKNLIADIIKVNKDNIVVCGNSSLNIMFDLISRSYTHGIDGGTPWSKLEKVKWLCSVPGYDRQFSISEYFSMEMINIPMDENGPDMDMVEEYVKDPAVKGIWCIPIYSNPTGITYSDEVVRRFARLKPASKDFRVFWDLAYYVHHLYSDRRDHLLNLLDECHKNNNDDLPLMFFSMSKISFAGGGVASVIASDNNIRIIKNALKYQTIGYDKINQLRHALFFKNAENVEKHMQKHAEIVKEKFEIVIKALEEIEDIAWFTRPNGGYFISLFVKEGTADKVIARCKKCGVVLTEAGSSYPYHKDPHNSHIRIAPTFVNNEKLKVALEVLKLSVRIEYLLSEK